MKFSRYTFLISCLLTSTLNVTHASPLVEVNDYVSILFEGSSSLVWQSNLFYDDEEEEDELLQVMSPGFVANIGSQSSGFNAYVQANYELLRFVDLSRLNQDYLHLDAIASYEGARFNLNAAYNFDEERTTAGEQGAVAPGGGSNASFIELHVTSAYLLGEYVFSPKFSFEPGIRYNDREFKERTNRLADVESFSIPLDIFYELTPKVDFSVGYQYTFEEVGIFTVEDFHRESHFFNLGARGDLLPKLNGSFKVGYRSVNPEGSTRNTDNTLGFNADFTYFATPKVTSKLGLFRGFEVGSEGQSVENSSVNVSLDYIISGNYSAKLFSSLSYRDFKDGNDGQDVFVRTGLRFSYVPNEYWNFGTGYTYSESDSNRLAQGYVNHILDISAALRY